MAALSELILQMVMYFHAGSQFKETKERIIAEYERRFLVGHCRLFVVEMQQQLYQAQVA